MCPYPLKHRLAFASGLMLCACAQLPPSVQALAWKDSWGQRGEQVLARDYEMCQTLVEQRRGLLSACMAKRGWSWADGPP